MSDSPSPDQKAPIFIGGTGRSGTSIVYRLLRRHPGIFAFRWETQFIVDRHGLLDLLKAEDLEDAALRFQRMVNGKWFSRPTKSNESAGLSADIRRPALREALGQFTRKMRTAETESERWTLARWFCDRMARDGMARQNAHRWCEKTPSNLLYAAMLHKLYPRMRFIHMVRDGRDVASSMRATGIWPINTGDLDAAVQHRDLSMGNLATFWKTTLEAGLAQLQQVPPEQVLQVRMEDLTMEPERHFRSICDFIGEPFAGEALDAISQESAHVSRWETELSPEEVTQFNGIAGEMLRHFGYPV